MGRLYRGQPVFSTGDWLPTISTLPSKGAVALTFDDGPTPETTPTILRLLRDHGAPATFFLSGERAAAAPALVQAIVDEGHDIYAHGWSHIRFDRHPVALLHEEMSRAEALLSTFRPTPSPYLVRLPYASGIRNPAIHKAIAAWKPDAHLAAWTYATPDDHIPLEEPDLAALQRRCASEVDRMLSRPRIDGAVLLMHEKGYDVDAPLNAHVAPLLLEHVLTGLQMKGLAVRRLEPLRTVPSLSRYMLSVSI